MTYDSFSLQFWCKNWMHCEDNVKYRPLVRKKARRTWRCEKLPSNNKLYNKTMSSTYHRELKAFSGASCADGIYTGWKLILQLLLLRIRTLFYLYWWGGLVLLFRGRWWRAHIAEMAPCMAFLRLWLSLCAMHVFHPIISCSFLLDLTPICCCLGDTQIFLQKFYILTLRLHCPESNNQYLCPYLIACGEELITHQFSLFS